MAPTEKGNGSDIRRQVAELLRLGPRHGVARLAREYRQAGSIQDERHVETIIRALCAQSSTWVGEFKKRATRRSKCPPGLRVVIERCLNTPSDLDTAGARLTPTDVLRRMRTPKSTGTLTIKDKAEVGFGGPYRFFLANLHTLSSPNKTPVDLTVHIECERVYVHGLALLAAWCERHAANVRLTADSTNVQRYLDATGFRRVVEEQVTIKAPLYDGDHHVALTRVEREDEQAADEVAGRLAGLFARHISLDQAKKSALEIVFAELVENVYRHARSNYGTYVMAQAFPQPQKLHVVVADTGIGIYASFRESDTAEVRERATSETAAIDLALENRVTSKPSRHAGYGLFLVRALVARNEGHMRLTSGRTTREFGPPRSRRKRAPQSEETTEHLPWNGTEISLIFNLDKPLPILDVYKELGPPERAEDFFK